MPSVYISPAIQPYNLYVTGGNEQQYMNYVADALEPYLRASNIAYSRSTKGMTLAQSIAQSNAGDFDLHLALHSNAGKGEFAGKLRGYQAYYNVSSINGKRAADIIVENAKKIYPLPNLVKTLPTAIIVEIMRTNAPAVLVEIAYHDNLQDANWINNNIQLIAKNLAQSLAQYFNIPFKEVCTTTGATLTGIGTYPVGNYARVCTMSTPLNIRAKPTPSSMTLGQIAKGQLALVLQAPANGWVKIRYNAIEGYVSSDYICGCLSTAPARQGVVSTAGANLNLRSRPSETAPILARIPNNTRLPIVEQLEEWYKVNYYGTLGYVAQRYVNAI